MYQLYQLYHSGREGIDTPAHEKELNAGPTTSSLCSDPGGSYPKGGVSADLLPAAFPLPLDEVSRLHTKHCTQPVQRLEADLCGGVGTQAVHGGEV